MAIRTLFAALLATLTADPVFAQPGGFVYALRVVEGAGNQIYGFSVNSTTGVLTSLAGFPVAAGGTGTTWIPSEGLVYDAPNARLYAIHDGSDTLSAFAVDRQTGALTALPYSPLSLSAGTWTCVAVSPDGSIVAVGDADSSPAMTTYSVTGTSAVIAAGGAVTTGAATPFSCAFSKNGAYLYAGGGNTTRIAGFAVNATTAALTPLNGSPFAGFGLPTSFATDALGRLFAADFVGATVRAYTTSSGIPTAVSQAAVSSGVNEAVAGVVSPLGYYFVADQQVGKVGAYRITGSGAATTLSAATGSPFSTGGTYTNVLATNDDGTLLFAGNSSSRNITTFRAAVAPTALTSLSMQPSNTLGTSGELAGLAYVPPIASGFVYALRQVNGGANQVYGFSVNASTGALTALAGFPVSTGGNGAANTGSRQLAYDRINARLFALNDGSDTVTMFAVNRLTGALTSLGSIAAGSGDSSALALNPAGTVLTVSSTGGMRSVRIDTAGGTLASSVVTGGAGGAFSADGARFFAAESATLSSYAVDAVTGTVTLTTGAGVQTGFGATDFVSVDAEGRVFFASRSGGGVVGAYASRTGFLTPVTLPGTASGFTSLETPTAAVHASSGHYIVGGDLGRIGVFAVQGSNTAPSLVPVSNSPFVSGSSLAALALDDSSTLLFAASGVRSIATLKLDRLTGALTSLTSQSANALGTSGPITGIAFAPALPSRTPIEIAAAGGPRGITTGPDGNIWFTQGSGMKIGRVTPAGVVTEFGPTSGFPDGITAGPDGNLWYAAYSGNKIGRITTAGVITEFALAPGTGPAMIVKGPDGNLWFTGFDAAQIGRITPSGTVTMFSTGITAVSQPFGIASGPDGNLWFTEYNRNKIGRITTAGVVTEFAIPTAFSAPTDIVSGPDGALWFTETTGRKIGRITTAGVVTEFGGLTSNPGGITLGADGNLWFSSAAKLGRLTPAGVLTEFTPATSPYGNSSFPPFITSGPDGNIWFAMETANKVGVFPLPQYGLAVGKGGTGAGTVTGAGGINCGSLDCGALFSADETVTLTASPSSGSRLAAWSGACGGAGTSCVVRMSDAKFVRATFNQTVNVNVAMTGGFGTLRSDPGGVSCSAPACVAAFDVNSQVTFTATPASGYRFVTWSGACTGSGSCTVTATAASPPSVTAVFVQQHTLSIGTVGDGNITSDIGGLSCGTGTACTAAIDAGTVVTLTATPASGFKFVGWSTGCATTTPTCEITVNSAVFVVGVFFFTLNPDSLPNATVGVPYSQTFTSNGGLAPPFSYATSGPLPAGLTLSGDGVLSGTPTALGTSQFTITALAGTWSGSGDYSLTVGCPAISVSPAALPAPVIGNAYAQTVTQSGGIGAVTFSLSGGALPAGVTLDASGSLSGTPTAEGAASFTVTATDSLGCTGSRTYSTTVAGLPTLSLSLAKINFGAVNNGAGTWTSQTPTQSVTLFQSGAGTVTWTAAADQPWIVVSPASGSGSATLAISVINTGSLPMPGVVSGTVTVTTTGGANNPSAPVNLTTIVGEGAPPAGLIDTPADGQSDVTGSLAVTGWAVDDVGVSAVRLCRVAAPGEAPGPETRCGGQPQVYIGDAVLVSGARPDVAALHPLKAIHDRAGWGYLLLTNFLPNQGNGTYTLALHAEDYDGHTVPLGTRTITLTNATATAPLGAIDTPAQGGTVSGSAYVNFGWALTPQPKMIPTDGSTIQPYIDSMPVGTVTYNAPRADIQTLFPGYANTDGAVGYSVMDTTRLSNGVHTISWVVIDNEGAAAGIGSRYFTVANSAGSSGVAAGMQDRAAIAEMRVAHASSLMQSGGSPAVDAGSPTIGAASTIAGMNLSDATVTITQGYGTHARKRVARGGAGTILAVAVGPLDRLVIEIGSGEQATWRGFEMQGTDLKALPLGSSFDTTSGRFAWAPGLGFGGTRRLAFVRTIAGRDELIRIDVTVGVSAAER